MPPVRVSDKQRSKSPEYVQHIMYNTPIMTVFFMGNLRSCLTERPGRARSNLVLLLPDCITLEEAPCLSKNQGCSLLLPRQIVCGAVSGKNMITAGCGSLLKSLLVICDPRQVLLYFKAGVLTLKMGVVSLTSWPPTMLWSHQ